MSNAETTIKFAIFNAITGQWHKKEQSNWAEILRDEIFKEIFQKHYAWAIKEQLIQEEIKEPIQPSEGNMMPEGWHCAVCSCKEMFRDA